MVDDKALFDGFVSDLTIRAGNSMIRYYLKQMYPETLDDAIWCEAVLDIWFYRHEEAKAAKNTTIG